MEANGGNEIAQSTCCRYGQSVEVATKPTHLPVNRTGIPGMQMVTAYSAGSTVCKDRELYFL